MGGPPSMHFDGSGPTVTAVSHFPDAQPWPLGQGLLQSPQFCVSDDVSTHCPLHAESCEGHCDAHPLDTQTSVGLHTTPHPPQLFGSATVEMHTPLQSDSP